MAFIGPRPPCLSLSSCDLGRFSYSAAGGQTSIGRVCGVAQRPPRGAPVRGHHLPPILDREAHAAIGDSILFCTIVFPSRARMLAGAHRACVSDLGSAPDLADDSSCSPLSASVSPSTPTLSTLADSDHGNHTSWFLPFPLSSFMHSSPRHLLSAYCMSGDNSPWAVLALSSLADAGECPTPLAKCGTILEGTVGPGRPLVAGRGEKGVRASSAPYSPQGPCA